jgi:hypothetical protein
MSAEYTVEIDRHGTRLVRNTLVTQRRWLRKHTIVRSRVIGAYNLRLDKIDADMNMNRPGTLKIRLSNGSVLAATQNWPET